MIFLILNNIIQNRVSFNVELIAVKLFETMNASSVNSNPTQSTESLIEDELFILPRYKPKDLANLCKGSKFTKYEIKTIYQGYKQVIIKLN